MFDFSILLTPQIDSGKLCALAQTGTTRMVAHADVPTFAELGYCTSLAMPVALRKMGLDYRPSFAP